jgi:hypothetical protein
VELRKQEEKNKQLEAELKCAEKAKNEFKAISDDRYEQIERLKSERLKFNIPEKSSDTALTERDIARYKHMISHYFLSYRKRISDVKKNRPKIKLQADCSKKCSFSLQQFFDDLYNERNTKPGKTTITHKLLFGDMNATLTKWLLSEWNVEYDKEEVYEEGKSGRGMGRLMRSFLNMDILAPDMCLRCISLCRTKEVGYCYRRRYCALFRDHSFIWFSILLKDFTQPWIIRRFSFS